MWDPSKRFLVIETRFKNFINSLLGYFFADIPNSQDRKNGSVSHTSLMMSFQSKMQPENFIYK